jgi:hypothetical protein
MKRPAFQFYPGDWRNDLALRKCSLAARGMWVEIMCIAHECEPYGTLRHNGEPLQADDIAGLVGMCSPREAKALIDELVRKGVAKLDATGVIYSKRMVRDEEIRNARAEGGKAGGEFGAKGAEHGSKGGRPPGQKGAAKGGSETPLPTAEKPPPSSSSSSSASAEETPGANAPSSAAADPDRPALTLVSPEAPGLPDCPHQDLIALYAKHLPQLRQPMRWDGERAEAMRSRWRECSKPTAFGDGYRTKAEGLEFWDRFFAYVAATPKLAEGIRTREGGQERIWKPSLDWLVQRANFTKVIEGAYTA